MSSLNRMTLIGNLGEKPTVRYTGAGKPVATLSVATNETWTDEKGVKQSRAEWHRCIAWGPMGENAAKYLDKGSTVYIEGRLQTKKWTDAKGIERYSTEIIAEDVKFLDKKGSGAGRNGPPPPDDADAPPESHRRSDPRPSAFVPSERDQQEMGSPTVPFGSR